MLAIDDDSLFLMMGTYFCFYFYLSFYFYFMSFPTFCLSTSFSFANTLSPPFYFSIYISLLLLMLVDFFPSFFSSFLPFFSFICTIYTTSSSLYDGSISSLFFLFFFYFSIGFVFFNAASLVWDCFRFESFLVPN